MMDIVFITNIGFILLAVYLILVGISSIVPKVSIPPIITGLIALIAGILILIGR
jgi:hypothetical protein